MAQLLTSYPSLTLHVTQHDEGASNVKVHTLDLFFSFLMSIFCSEKDLPDQTPLWFSWPVRLVQPSELQCHVSAMYLNNHLNFQPKTAFQAEEHLQVEVSSIQGRT